MPLNNKLLFDANMTFFRYNPAFGFPPPDGITNLIPVTEQSARAGVHERESGPAASRAAPRRTRRRCAGRRGQLRLPRARAVGLRRRRDQQLQRGRVVRHRFAQHAGWDTSSTGCVSSTRRSPQENQLAYRFNQGVPESGDLPAADAEQQHDHAAARHLHPGPVHARPPDAVGRGPVGSGQQLRAGRGQRRVRDLRS